MNPGEHEMIWINFASACLGRSSEVSVSHAAALADAMCLEYDKRFGHAAVMLQGIRNCFVCQEEIAGEFVSDFQEGEYRKFCRTCIEKQAAVKTSNPGIVK